MPKSVKAMTGFAPVMVAPAVGEVAAASAPCDPAPTLSEADWPSGGTTEVELCSGVKLRITGAVDATVLRQVLSALS